MRVLLFTAACMLYCYTEYKRVSRIEKEFEAFKKQADEEIAENEARTLEIRARTLKYIQVSKEEAAKFQNATNALKPKASAPRLS